MLEAALEAQIGSNSVTITQETILNEKDIDKLQKYEQGPTLWNTHDGFFITSNHQPLRTLFLKT